MYEGTYMTPVDSDIPKIEEEIDGLQRPLCYFNHWFIQAIYEWHQYSLVWSYYICSMNGIQGPLIHDAILKNVPKLALFYILFPNIVDII